MTIILVLGLGLLLPGCSTFMESYTHMKVPSGDYDIRSRGHQEFRITEIDSTGTEITIDFSNEPRYYGHYGRYYRNNYNSRYYRNGYDRCYGESMHTFNQDAPYRW